MELSAAPDAGAQLTAQQQDVAPPQKPQIPLLLAVVFLSYLGQMTLGPVIAPLVREVGLAEWQIGVTISLAAVMVVLTSQFWGRRSQALGRKSVLVLALGLATATMGGFTLTAALGMQGLIPAGALFICFLALRGVGFGFAIAAIQPAAQAYVADVTSDTATRTKAMAGIGAAQGISMIGGAVIGGALAGIGLLWALLVVPLLLAAAFALVTLRLRPEPGHALIPKPAKVRFTDSRVWPFLVAGFGMFTALGFMQVLIGFVVQDRYSLSSEMTGVVTGGGLLAAGIGMVVAQAVIVPRTGWPPVQLLRVGAVTAALGYALMVPHLPLWVLLTAIFLTGVGLGTAMPGYTTGPTLRLRREEHGSVAGLIGATNGMTFVIAPAASTLLYGVNQALPLLVSAIVMAMVAGFVLLYPGLRQLEAERA